jgi:hypothetical protein
MPVPSSEKEDELYNALKDLPDFDRLPLPESWYKKYNLRRPEPVDFKTFAMERRWLAHKYDSDLTFEIRKEPAPGGVRPILESEPIPVEIIQKPIDQTSSETTLSPVEESAPPTESNDSAPQQS